MKTEYQKSGSVLGLDIGPTSVGWALIEENEQQPCRLIDMGVRIFEAGVEGDIESGRDESRAAKRRMARLHRRQLERASRRLKVLAEELQRRGLLPPGDVSTPDARKRFFDELDKLLAQGLDNPALLPFILRARALHERLDPHETGRALYHLAHKRGFLSNRKSQPKEDEELNTIAQAVGQLRQAMQETGAQTPGEHFAALLRNNGRVRGHHTFRNMNAQEFDLIWDTQRAFHPDVLSDEARKSIGKKIFFQRPLKSNKGLTGRCELEGARRAPLALLVSQRFRMLQKVNDLRLVSPDGLQRELTASERAELLRHLELQQNMKFTAIRKKLKLQGKFNFEIGGEESLPGNRTAARMASVFGQQRWQSMTPGEQDLAVQHVRSIRKPEALERAAADYWKLDPNAARDFAKIPLEEGHVMLSQKAMVKLLPLMERGMPFATARKELYGAAPPPRAYDKLPPVHSPEMPAVTNPAVRRALTEMRKVVNAVTAKYGKPGLIRIELARDMKRPRKARQQISKRIRANKNKRDAARQQLLKEASGALGSAWEPKRSDIEKWLLRDECGGICPYTGKPISFHSLFVEPEFDIEHIIPFSRSLDNSFLNKTLCCATENRIKSKRTPWEAYGGTARWDEIIGRVRKFTGDANVAKLQRFQIRDADKEIDGFAARELNDTRYISRLAVQYAGLLYGAGADGVDPSGRRRVQAARGQITAHLRDVYELNSLLGDGGEKYRGDHRHHAVDALCVALTTPRAVKQLSDAAAAGEDRRRAWYDTRLITDPWPGFLDDARNAVNAIVVSHCPSRKVNSAMHDETVYSKPHADPMGRACVHVRKPLAALTDKMVDNIVDDRVREKVRQALNGRAPKDAFKDSASLPFFETRDHRRIPIKTARIRVYQSVNSLGRNAAARNVVPGSNHHVEIFAVEQEKGGVKWEGRMVTTIEAMARLHPKSRIPVVNRAHENGGKFLFSLSPGDTVRVTLDGEQKLLRLRTISKNNQGRLRLDAVCIREARKKAEIMQDKKWIIFPTLHALADMQFQKVTVTPLGEVFPCND